MNYKELSTQWNLKFHNEPHCWPHMLELTASRPWNSGVTSVLTYMMLVLLTFVLEPMSVFLSSSHEYDVNKNNLGQTSTVNLNTCCLVWDMPNPQILDLKGGSLLIFLSVISEFLEIVQ